MATASVTNTFLQDATTSAADMNQNFTDVETFLNASTVHVDGSKSMSGDFDAGGFQFTSVGDPSGASDAVTKAYVDNAVQGAVFAPASSFVSVNGGYVSMVTAVGDVDGWMDLEVSATDFTCPVDGLYAIRIKYTNTYTGVIPAYVRFYRKQALDSTYVPIGLAGRYIATGTYNNWEYGFLLCDAGQQFKVRTDFTSTVTNLEVRIQKLGVF